jgi:(R,R)-butanediol dehydrogenase / meso-butanediol dehydrogenase / diacetyl reductase
MKAGLVTKHRTFALVDVPDPEARPGCAVVDVHLCGICGTDLHGYLSHDPYNPAICGHEWVGVVREVGDGVGNVAIGQRVVAGVAPACGRCATCRAGQASYCQTSFLGMIGRDALAPPHGGFAPTISLDATRLLVVPDALSDVEAAIVEPTTVALHALGRTPVPHGGTVIVQGCGPIGLLCLQLVRHSGAGRLIAIDPVAQRRDLALSLGADEAVHPDDAASVAGADLVFECAGVPATVQSAVNLVRRGGTVNLVGLASGQATISPHMWLINEVTMVASLGYRFDEFATVMNLIARRSIDVAALHDRTVALADSPAIFASLAADPTSATKVLIDPR